MSPGPPLLVAGCSLFDTTEPLSRDSNMLVLLAITARCSVVRCSTLSLVIISIPAGFCFYCLRAREGRTEFAVQFLRLAESRDSGQEYKALFLMLSIIQYLDTVPIITISPMNTQICQFISTEIKQNYDIVTARLRDIPKAAQLLKKEKTTHLKYCTQHSRNLISPLFYQF